MATRVLVNPDNGIDFPYSDALRASRPDLVEKWFENGVEVPSPLVAKKPVELPKSENAVTSVNIEFVPGSVGKVRGEIDLPGIVATKADYVVDATNVTIDDLDGRDFDGILALASDIGVSYADVEPTFEHPGDFRKYVKRDIRKKINQIVFARQRAEAARAHLAQKGAI